VARGLRAQLKSHNLLTGQLAVSLDFHPNAAPAQIDWSGPVPEIPTVSGGIDALTAGVSDLLAKLNQLPLDEIAGDLRSSIASLSGILRDFEAGTPALVGALDNAERTLASANALIAPGSQASQDLRRALRELADAARSLRLLADQLEQHPESLLRGKETP
jgi:paraquat-inducible protein B